ncbi:MAG: DUF4395 domain-containing protein [Sulfurimonas sp.]|nr:DUF4395 domain-containing protein [Sulfurimonas sp.]
MAYNCPLTFQKVESHISRLSSFLVSSLIIAYLITSNVYILYFLLIDFLIRLYMDKSYSLIFLFAKAIKNILALKDSFCDGGAKRLAAYFGLLFVFLLIATHYLDQWLVSLAIAAIFLVCSLLDVLFDFCIGCKVYYLIKRVFPNFMS